MFIPVSTDAPIYHWPWVTLSLILANVAAFVLTGFGAPGAEAAWQPWVLEYGSGLHPLEWISCNFVHFGLVHLVGNMIFLWVFGLVVEGKIGWWRYLLVYFGIGIVHGFVEQLMMLGSAGPAGSGGASGVIFGLMAIALVWAPKNEVTFTGVFTYGFYAMRGYSFEVTILTLAIYYFSLQAALVFFTGFAMSSAMIHILGAVVGFFVGVVMLRQGWVDCENWDLFAVLAGTHGSTAVSEELYYRGEATQLQMREGAKVSSNGPASLTTNATAGSKRGRSGKAVQRLRYHLESGRPAAALAEYRTFQQRDPDRPLSQTDLRALAEALCESRLWDEARPLLEQYVKRSPDDAEIGLKLVELLVEVEQRPRYALRVLEEIPADVLEERLERRRARLETRARNMIDDGVLELEGRSWS